MALAHVKRQAQVSINFCGNISRARVQSCSAEIKIPASKTMRVSSRLLRDHRLSVSRYDQYSYAPTSTAAPRGRATPAKSIVGAFVEVPRSIAGELLYTR
jgi:hypothetical protein